MPHVAQSTVCDIAGEEKTNGQAWDKKFIGGFWGIF
jgi:hypothetical protein